MEESALPGGGLLQVVDHLAQEGGVRPPDPVPHQLLPDHRLDHEVDQAGVPGGRPRRAAARRAVPQLLPRQPPLVSTLERTLEHPKHRADRLLQSRRGPARDALLLHRLHQRVQLLGILLALRRPGLGLGHFLGALAAPGGRRPRVRGAQALRPREALEHLKSGVAPGRRALALAPGLRLERLVRLQLLLQERHELAQRADDRAHVRGAVGDRFDVPVLLHVRHGAPPGAVPVVPALEDAPREVRLPDAVALLDGQEEAVPAGEDARLLAHHHHGDLDRLDGDADAAREGAGPREVRRPAPRPGCGLLTRPRVGLWGRGRGPRSLGWPRRRRGRGGLRGCGGGRRGGRGGLRRRQRRPGLHRRGPGPLGCPLSLGARGPGGGRPACPAARGLRRGPARDRLWSGTSSRSGLRRGPGGPAICPARGARSWFLI